MHGAMNLNVRGLRAASSVFHSVHTTQLVFYKSLHHLFCICFSCVLPSWVTQSLVFHLLAENWLSVHGGVLRVKMPMCSLLLLWANPKNTIPDPNMCNFFKEGQDHQGINEPWASWRSKSLPSAFSLHHWQEWQQPLWGLFHLFPCLPAAWRLVLGRGRVPLPGRAALRGRLRPHWAACAWGGTWGGQQMKSRQLKGLVREDTELMLCCSSEIFINSSVGYSESRSRWRLS